MGAAAGNVPPYCGSALEFLGLVLAHGVIPLTDQASVPPITGVGVTVAPDGNPAGLPIAISSGFAFRTTTTLSVPFDCGSKAQGFDLVCGMKPPAGPITVDVLFIGWTAPSAGTGILPFLDNDRDGKPGNNVKPTKQFPYATTIGGDGLFQVVAGANGKRNLELGDEVTGKFKPVSAIQFTNGDSAGWIVFNPPPDVRYLPGVYDYTGNDFAAPHVGFDVASPLGASADPTNPDLATLFFAPQVIQGP